MNICWLRSNRRLFGVGVVLSIMALLMGAGLATAAYFYLGGFAAAVVGCMAAALGGWLLVFTLRAMLRPWLSCDGESLFIYLTPAPIQIPLEVVECFFRGQGPAMLGGPEAKDAEVSNIVIRLAERARDWKTRAVVARWGQWQDGYIIIRGSWCEPITRELIDRLNRDLAQAQKKAKSPSG